MVECNETHMGPPALSSADSLRTTHSSLHSDKDKRRWIVEIRCCQGFRQCFRSTLQNELFTFPHLRFSDLPLLHQSQFTAIIELLVLLVLLSAPVISSSALMKECSLLLIVVLLLTLEGPLLIQGICKSLWHIVQQSWIIFRSSAVIRRALPHCDVEGKCRGCA